MLTSEQYLVTPQTSDQISREAARAETVDPAIHELEARRARHYITPSIVQIVSYTIASLSGLAALNWQNLRTLVDRSLPQDISIGQNLQSQVSMYADNQIIGWFTIVLFWGMVGLIAYTLYWLAMAFVTAARNEIVVETAFSNRGHLWDKVRIPMIKLTLLGAMAAMFMISLRLLVPILSEVFARGVFNLSINSIPLAVIEFIAATAGGIIILYIQVSLFLVFRHADGIF